MTKAQRRNALLKHWGFPVEKLNMKACKTLLFACMNSPEPDPRKVGQVGRVCMWFFNQCRSRIARKPAESIDALPR